MLSIAGKKKAGTLMMLLLFDKIITTSPINISRIERMFMAINFIFFTFSDVPMQIHLMSYGS
jgi:hypothetical protein